MLHYFPQMQTGLDDNHQTSLLHWTALHYASLGGHIRAMKLLLGRHGDADITDIDEQTPLHVALSSGCQSAAAYLVKRGSDVNAQDRNGLTPLHICVAENSQATTGWTESKRARMVAFLLANSALPCARNGNGEPVLHAAIRHKVGEETIALLAAKAREQCGIDVTDDDGMTALHIADTPEIARMLISAGAGVNASANDGSTALHLHTDNPRLVALLLGSGASRTLGDNRGRIPLHVALDRSDPVGEVVDLLSTTRAEVNAQDGRGMTPLHVLCSHAHTAARVLGPGPGVEPSADARAIGGLMERLLLGGADVDSRNTTGRTPLHLCIASRQFSKASILLAHGADPHSVDRYGLTPYRMDTSWFRKHGHIDKRATAVRQASPPIATTTATNGKHVTFSEETRSGESSPVVRVTITEPSDVSRREKHVKQRRQKNRLTPDTMSRRTKPSRLVVKHSGQHPLPDVTSSSAGNSVQPVAGLLPNWNDVVDAPRVMHTTAARRRVRRTRKAANMSHVTDRGGDINGITREMNLILTHH